MADLENDTDLTQDGWEFFQPGTRVGMTTSSQPFISIHGAGRFSLNRIAAELLGGHVRLAYNRNRRQIGFFPAQEGDRGAYPIRRASGRKVENIVSATAFLSFYDLDAEKLKGAYAVQNQANGLILQLPEEK